MTVHPATQYHSIFRNAPPNTRLRISTRYLAAAVALSCLSPTGSSQADGGTTHRHDGPLSEILPSLYGGDGITLHAEGHFSHAAHFLNDSLEEFNKLSLSLQNLSYPSLNASAGIQFRYNPILDDFSQESSLSASVFAFDAETIGKGNLQIGTIFSSRTFTTLEGESLDDLTIDLRHVDLGDNGPDLPCIGGPPGACYAFEHDVIRLDINLGLREEILQLSGVYGITDTFDVGVMVPLVKTDLDVVSMASVQENPTKAFFPERHLHEFGGNADSAFDSLSSSKSGFGDTTLRFHYWAQRGEQKKWDIGLASDIRLPTGNESNFQGLPGVGIQSRIVLSKTIAFLDGDLRPHANISYGFNMGPSSEQELRYAIGTSYSYSWNDGVNGLALSADFLGKHVTQNRDHFGDDQYDLSVGVKLALMESIQIYYNCLIPIDNSGLRPKSQHVFGLQVNF